MAYIKKINREARDAAIVASYNITHNVRATATETGVSKTTCRKVLAAAGIDTKAARTQYRTFKQAAEVNSVSMYTINNEYICGFNSIKEAVEYLQKTGKPRAARSGIVPVLEGKRATAYGYKWKYQDEELNNAPYQYVNRRPVHMYTLFGEYVRTFPSAAAAAKQLNICADPIYPACAGKYKTAYGYQWRFADTENEISEDISSFKPVNAKSVLMYSATGEFIRAFDSIRNAAIHVHAQGLAKSVHGAESNIQHVLKGKCKTAYGYQWHPAALH